jgi:hypothetical protein
MCSFPAHVTSTYQVPSSKIYCYLISQVSNPLILTLCHPIVQPGTGIASAYANALHLATTDRSPGLRFPLSLTPLDHLPPSPRLRRTGWRAGTMTRIRSSNYDVAGNRGWIPAHHAIGLTSGMTDVAGVVYPFRRVAESPRRMLYQGPSPPSPILPLPPSWKKEGHTFQCGLLF